MTMATKKSRSSASDAAQDDYIEKLVKVRRVTKVVKGGRIMSFSAAVVCGDGKGRVGYGVAKAREVQLAIQKANQVARRNMIKVKLKGNTLQHAIIGRHGASEVFMKPASEGTGLIAGSAMRAVFEVAGVQNVLSKCIGSNNPLNVIRATINALQGMATPAYVAAKRGISIEALEEV
jgi:small subunit ribosomal protein S5